MKFQYGLSKNIQWQQRFGDTIVEAMPNVLNWISILGIFAMLAVGGGIFAHHLPMIEHIAKMGGMFSGIIEIFLATLLGLFCGLFVVVVKMLVFKTAKTS